MSKPMTPDEAMVAERLGAMVGRPSEEYLAQLEREARCQHLHTEVNAFGNRKCSDCGGWVFPHGVQ